MHQQFKAISFSYKKAPLHIRELGALNEDRSNRMINSLTECLDTSEAPIISTCNRTEIYYSSPVDLSTEIVK